MHRRACLVAVFLCLVLPVALSAQDFSDVVIETTAVSGNIHMLQGAGGNLAICSGEDGVILVDDQFAPLTEKIRAAIGEVSDGDIRFVLNTHWHGDHVGGNENLGKAGTLIVAHDNVRVRMSTEQFNELFDRSTPASPKDALPVVTFNDTATFHLNGETIRAFHVPPAHTDGDSIVHFVNSDVVHMGDLYFQGKYPFIDVDSGGSIDGVIAAADQVLAMVDDNTKIIPGHGPLSNKAELMEYRNMLSDIRKIVADMMAAGKSAEEIQAAMPTKPWDEVWGGGFMKPDVFASIVVRSLEIHGR